MNAKEPWVILTNDCTATRNTVLEWYAHRFEIEETFKDLKHLVNFLPTWFKKNTSVVMVFWFFMLGFWLLWQVSRLPHIWRERLSHHIKKRISWVKYIFEVLQKELRHLIFPEPLSRKEVFPA
jgi:hypothetical protein